MKIKESEFLHIRAFVYEHCGIRLTDQKKTLVESRFSNLIEMKGFNSFGEYFKTIEDDLTGNELAEFINKITTNHTYFFREERHFDFLKKIALPEIVKREQRSKDIRIWSAGCSSGEEPYSIAITLEEFLGFDKNLWDSKILATDISLKVLKQATIGEYTFEQVLKLEDSYRKKYFTKKSDEFYEINDSLKDEIIFRRFNLTSDFPFKNKFHIIFCRNVMIYFDKNSKKSLIDKFYDALESGGYLFIGHSETIEDRSQGFKYIQPAIYKKE